MKALLVGTILGLLAMGASAQTTGTAPDTSAFGLRLGGMFALPECARETNGSLALLKKLHEANREMMKKNGDADALRGEDERFAEQIKGDSPEQYTAIERSSPCVEWPHMITDYVNANTPVVTAEIKIELPINQSPAILSGLDVYGQVVDGTLESIWFFTGGLKSQDQVFAALEKKYGKPTRFKENTKQNTFGALFMSHYAEWRFTNLTVVFWGATDSIDSGSVQIDTKKGAGYRSALLKKSQNGPKL